MTSKKRRGREEKRRQSGDGGHDDAYLGPVGRRRKERSRGTRSSPCLQSTSDGSGNHGDRQVSDEPLRRPGKRHLETGKVLLLLFSKKKRTKTKKKNSYPSPPKPSSHPCPSLSRLFLGSLTKLSRYTEVSSLSLSLSYYYSVCL